MNIILLDVTKFGDFTFWIDFLLSLIIIVLFVFFMWRFLQRVLARVLYVGGFTTVLIARIFDLETVSQVVLTMLIIISIAFVITNIGDFRPITANPLKGKGGFLGLWPSKDRVRKIYDKNEFYHQVQLAVESLSKSKTGALLTFEKKSQLSDIIKNGTVINAPLTSELITTIFYPGTRLHDGAVVIRDNNIIAASVYYTATTKPLNGKYGSRHRAAIGISEITDSVTIVVSEETGRVSIAYNGDLIPTNPDNFDRVFREYMEEMDEKIVS
ncbi:MAG: DNA integrity scanning protein DisA nucleotide-binding domain protein [Bacilli bacterium]|nr:DNA integrity scanning protein DisA nucleotide-binding domain protein [Bacilli bacterium]